MKNYTTSANDTVLTVNDAIATFSGYGHYKIEVTLKNEVTGEIKKFIKTTSNMPGIDNAKDLEGQEKYEALYEIIESYLDDEVVDWILSDL